MLNKIGVNACGLRPSLQLSQHVDIEEDRGKRLCFQALNPEQHIDLEQDRSIRLCFGAFFKNLAAHRC